MASSGSKLTAWELVDLGHAYARIGQIRAGRRLGPTKTDPLGFLRRMQDFCHAVEVLGLDNSKQLAEKMQKGRLEQLESALQNYAQATLYSTTAAELRISLTALWDQLMADTTTLQVYIAQPFVWEEPFSRFIESPRAFLNLKERGRYDKEWPEAFDDNLAEAARCLSVRFWSGAMLFTVRAVEAGIKHYFTLTTDESPGIDPWGKLISRLKGSDAKKQLIEAIERLKTRYRDPIAHITETNLTFDEDNTLDMLTRSAAVMSHMTTHLLDSHRIILVERTLTSETLLVE